MDITKIEVRGADGAPEIAASRAVLVTFFEDRAEVSRRAKVMLLRGSQWIAIAGVSPFVDERTATARIVAGDAKVNAARVTWRAHLTTELGREDVERLHAEERSAKSAVEEAARARSRADRRVDQVNGLHTRWAAEIAKVAPRVRDADRLDAWRAAWRSLGEAADEAHRAIASANEQREDAEETAARAALRLREGTIAKPRYEALVAVDVEGAEDGDEVEIEVTYRVPCALWRPEHLFRLADAADASSDGKLEKKANRAIEVVSWATVWSAAGEAWEGVTARFSTARPARDASPPLVRDDVLALRRKSAEERKSVVVEAREHAPQVAGLDRGTRAVEEMPGVDDGGEPLVLEALEPLTIASDGRPMRVEVGRRTLGAEVDRVLYPELGGAAHVRATATNSGGPLLAGPVRVARGSALVGKSKIGYVGAGEPFELGFGADDGVRARRHMEEQRDTTAIIGTQKIRRKVDVFLSNLSGEIKGLTVTERVPVSEIADVEITMGESADFGARDAEGFLRARVQLAPHETKRISFSYEIRAGSNVVLPF
ncbi:MAG: DUF4139 domain-containing protein [Polyangiaceae bacterium]